MKKLLICLMAVGLVTLSACTSPDPDKTGSNLANSTPSELVAQTEAESKDILFRPEKTPADETKIEGKKDIGEYGETFPEETDCPQEPSVQAPTETTVPVEPVGKQESSSVHATLPTEKQPESNETTNFTESPTEEVNAPEENEIIQTGPIAEPEPEPEITEPALPEFNVQTWIDYAISYGQQLGLVYDSSATECWDNPIIASSQSVYLERDISSRLNRYLNRGMTGFCVWVETRTDGKYDLFIGYR